MRAPRTASTSAVPRVRRLLAALATGAALWLAPAALAAPAHASAWCGSGESLTDLPDLTTGPQFHLVYAVSADGADDFPDVAGQMAADAGSIDAWWAQQDPTRTLRYASVASVGAGIALPGAAAAYGYPTPVVGFGAVAGGAIVFLHRGNLRRLRAGTENRFHFRRPARA